MTRQKQFEIIEEARRRLLDEARRFDIPLHEVQYVVPFVPTDFTLETYLFYETDDQLRTADANGWAQRLMSQFKNLLSTLSYPAHLLPQVTFEFDSHENVVANYNSNYFYRLR